MSQYSDHMKRVLGLLVDNQVDSAVQSVEADVSLLSNNAVPVIARAVKGQVLSTDDLSLALPLFRQWQPGENLEIGDVRQYDGGLYETIQAHSTQEGWEPPQVPALFKLHAPAGFVPYWKQPVGSEDAYALGDRVRHNGKVWESTVDANVWEPGEYGWVEIEV